MQLLSACVKSLALLVTFALLLSVSHVTRAADNAPLRPVDTSSPRATLQGFIEISDDVYRRMRELLEAYDASGRLYMTGDEIRKQSGIYRVSPKVIRFIDASRIPPVLRGIVTIERVLQLKEILDRIELPAAADIPDKDAMMRSGAKRWRLPNTEIDLVLIEQGPRAGEYLVSADTVDQLPQFYDLVKDLPYKPGAGRDLSDSYRRISGGRTETIYDAYIGSPVGLGLILPPRWILSLPNWAKVRVGGMASWQWLGVCLGLLFSALIVLAGHRMARRHADDDEIRTTVPWRALPVPLAILLVTGILVPLVGALLQIGGSPRTFMEYAATGLLFLSAAWLAIVAFAVIGEILVASEHLTSRSLDSQLIRLGTRLIGVVVAIALLIEGGDELGLPAYSVLAGLGVGGLAVALAARDTIANLIGSLLITLEKPFRVGHYVRIGGSEGTVEDVGFRSTRIRTIDNSLVSIPSSNVVNMTIENLSLRPKRRQRFILQVSSDTSRGKLEALVGGIRQIITDHPLAEAASCHVRVNNLGESSLDILVIFHFLVDDYAIELAEREAILLHILDLVRDMDVDLAFPTRTLHIAPGKDAAAEAALDRLAYKVDM